jgi:hypothetical protein
LGNSTVSQPNGTRSRSACSNAASNSSAQRASTGPASRRLTSSAPGVRCSIRAPAGRPASSRLTAAFPADRCSASTDAELGGSSATAVGRRASACGVSAAVCGCPPDPDRVVDEVLMIGAAACRCGGNRAAPWGGECAAAARSPATCWSETRASRCVILAGPARFGDSRCGSIFMTRCSHRVRRSRAGTRSGRWHRRSRRP